MSVATTAYLALCISLASAATSGHFLMPWMCLERCGGNESSIDANIQQIASNSIVSAAAFELFNLGPNGALVVNNLTGVIGRCVSLMFGSVSI